MAVTEKVEFLGFFGAAFLGGTRGKVGCPEPEPPWGAPKTKKTASPYLFFTPHVRLAAANSFVFMHFAGLHNKRYRTLEPALTSYIHDATWAVPASGTLSLLPSATSAQIARLLLSSRRVHHRRNLLIPLDLSRSIGTACRNLLYWHRQS